MILGVRFIVLAISLYVSSVLANFKKIISVSLSIAFSIEIRLSLFFLKSLPSLPVFGENNKIHPVRLTVMHF
jgi:hypothetical protein